MCAEKDKREEIEVTPEMIKAGVVAYSEHYIGIREGYQENLEAALVEAFRRMLGVSRSRS